MNKDVYYSHSKIIYNTQREQNERVYLMNRFDTVVCPNRDLSDLGSFKKYLHEVDKCSILVASVNNGHVSKGVLIEILRALSDDKPAYILQPHKNTYILIRFKGYKIVNPRDYSNHYAKTFI